MKTMKSTKGICIAVLVLLLSSGEVLAQTQSNYNDLSSIQWSSENEVRVERAEFSVENDIIDSAIVVEDGNAQERPAAIIVFRHAQDLATQEQKDEMKKHNDDHPNDLWSESRYFIHEKKDYPLPMKSQGSVEIPWQRLSKEGFKRANRLAEVLPAWITEKWAPVNLVITKEPKTKEQTQNPFQTVMPFAYAISDYEISQGRPSIDVEVKLGNTHHDRLDFDPKTLISDGFSTAICWDRQGLWEDDKDGETMYILESLTKPEQWPGALKRPAKGGSFYIFTNPDSNGKYDVEQYNFDGNDTFELVK